MSANGKDPLFLAIIVSIFAILVKKIHGQPKRKPFRHTPYMFITCPPFAN